MSIVSGIIGEATRKLLPEMKMEFCKECIQYMYCIQPFNSDCDILVSKVREAYEEEKVREKERKKSVVEFPVNMDEMQQNIMIELLNARKECTEENLLTARGCVAIIDALFYLVKRETKTGMMGVDWGDPNGDRTGGRSNEKNK